MAEGQCRGLLWQRAMERIAVAEGNAEDCCGSGAM